MWPPQQWQCLDHGIITLSKQSILWGFEPRTKRFWSFKSVYTNHSTFRDMQKPFILVLVASCVLVSILFDIFCFCSCTRPWLLVAGAPSRHCRIRIVANQSKADIFSHNFSSLRHFKNVSLGMAWTKHWGMKDPLHKLHPICGCRSCSSLDILNN